MIYFFFPLFGIPLSEPFGFYDASKGLSKKPFPTLFLENYTCAERKNFTRNALQSAGIRRGSPPLRRIKTDRERHGSEPEKAIKGE